jgi:hypothetical protein
MIKQRLSLLSKKTLKYGQVLLKQDELTGKIDFQAQFEIEKLWIPISKYFHEEIQVDPKLFLSATIVPGFEFEMGPLSIHVISVADQKAVISFVYDSTFATIKGSGELDVSAQCWLINRLVGKGSITVVGDVEPEFIRASV